ncbi:Antidote-toxin recognition MazE, antitoxin [Haloechinothrix alba]|uniref:Antidote-toxin recognition MazE, antitoxin n=1 Tax=Haloechinothrix alba TaxID=664784 RepID=A0A238X995_9PSEU|nr:AbrB/MazE/SpoVT family DNA-binding domain-containing protein [Haloechinothrix alba]SNR55192.1 Antidote-toxin recognition MazE, antitoxin [Haloechinothrix alba]
MTSTEDHSARGDVSVARDGRVTLPAQVRRAAGIGPGTSLVCYVDRGRVVLEDRAHLLTRLQDEAIAAKHAAGHTGSAVDELIAERHAEAAREDFSSNATVTEAPAPGDAHRTETA